MNTLSNKAHKYLAIHLKKVYSQYSSFKYALILALLFHPFAVSEQHDPGIKLSEIVEQKLPRLESVAKAPALVAVLERQLLKLLSLEQILQLDKKWQSTPLEKRPLLRGPSETVNKLLDDLYGEVMFSEVFLIDANGATVYAKPSPTDFWQGDEDKFIQPAVKHQNYTGVIGYDSSARTFQFQVSLPIFNASASRFVGVLVVGIELPLSVLTKIDTSEGAG